MVGFDAGLDIDQSDVSGLSLCSEKILIYNIKSPQLRARVFWHMMYFDLVYMNKKVSVKIYELFSYLAQLSERKWSYCHDPIVGIGVG